MAVMVQWAFWREKFSLLKAVLDGGDGGGGGDVYIQADENLNTWSITVSNRFYNAAFSENGRVAVTVLVNVVKTSPLKVFVGTRAVDIHTNEIVAEVAEHGKKVMAGKGGWHGLGNTRFKSSVNRAPRRYQWY